MTYKRGIPAVAPDLVTSNSSGQYRKAAMPAAAARILVAEGSGALLRLLEAHPGAVGFEFLSANDGREALEVACSELPDVIVADFHMPRMNGIELCKAVRGSVWLRPLIVLVASSPNSEALAAAAQAGAAFCLSKPVDPTRLVGLILALTR